MNGLKLAAGRTVFNFSKLRIPVSRSQNLQRLGTYMHPNTAINARPAWTAKSMFPAPTRLTGASQFVRALSHGAKITKLSESLQRQTRGLSRNAQNKSRVPATLK